MEINKQYFIVLIDKEKQSKKRSMIGSLYIPENFQDMQNNLQYGEVLSIGSLANEHFPEVEVGDILLFTHHVEYKPRTVGDMTYQDLHLVETFDNGDEARTVDIAHEVFGVIKSGSNTILPYKDHVFCHEEFQEATFKESTSKLWVPIGWGESNEQRLERLEELKAQIGELVNNINFVKSIEQPRDVTNARLQEIYKLINGINKERKEITTRMNEHTYIELTCLYINPETSNIWQAPAVAGDKIYAHSWALYPLDIDGVHFTVVKQEYIALLKHHDMKKFIPLHDRVLVTPEKAEDITAGGIIIPETVEQKPNKGIVVASGPGYKNEQTTVKEGDEILFSKYAGTPIQVNGTVSLMMRESDIFGYFK